MLQQPSGTVLGKTSVLPLHATFSSQHCAPPTPLPFSCRVCPGQKPYSLQHWRRPLEDGSNPTFQRKFLPCNVIWHIGGVPLTFPHTKYNCNMKFCIYYFSQPYITAKLSVPPWDGCFQMQHFPKWWTKPSVPTAVICHTFGQEETESTCKYFAG